MGMGDVKLATFLGILLGKKVVVAIAIGFIMGDLFSIFLLIFKIKKIKYLLPSFYRLEQFLHILFKNKL